jgi:hypothetical protein
MKRLLCSALLIFFSTVVFAQTPIISALSCAAASTTSVTCTWTTDIAADTFTFYGYSDDYGYDQGAIDTGAGVTSHTQTITGLHPGVAYNWAARSRGFTTGVPDNNKVAVATLASQVSPTGAPTTGSYDFWTNFAGAVHITQGYTSYVDFQMGNLQGTASRGIITTVLSGLPTGVTADYPPGDPGPGPCSSFYNSGTNTLTWYDVGCFPTPYFQLKATANATLGAFTLTATITTAGGVPGQKVITWPMVVDASTPLTPGTPSSYPQIPCLTAASKETDGVTACPNYGDQGYAGPINYQHSMTYWGAWWCLPTDAGGHPNNNDPAVSTGAWFYDGEWVYFQIHDYDATNALTGNAAQWNTCAITNWETAYVTNYIIPNNGATAGYNVFPAGPYYGSLRGGSANDATAVHDLAIHSASAALDSGQAWYEQIRETCYLVDTNRYDVKLGTGSVALLQRAVDMCLGNVDQQVYGQTAVWVQPFMLGLAAQELIFYYQDGHQSDVRIPIYVKKIADWLWTNAWNTTGLGGVTCTANGFYYNSYMCATGTNRDPAIVALNQLISPLYAWLFQLTGTTAYQTEGDTAFQAGVIQDPGNGMGFSGKNFSQQYRWSMSYLTWRSAQGLAGNTSNGIYGTTKIGGNASIH